MATPALLTAVDSINHVHLIVGSNPLAGARCNRALEVGAVPKIVAPEDAQIHYALAKKIEEGKVEWIKREFQDSDLTSLGRDEVDNVVDAVFVTKAGKGALSEWQCLDTFGHWTDRSFRHTHFYSLPKIENPRQRRRRTEPLHFHPPLHTLFRPSADWCHNVRQGL